MLKRVLPGAHLTLAGALPPGGVWAKELASGEQQRSQRVRVTGFVANLTPLLQKARVFLSPVIDEIGYKQIESALYIF